MRALSVRQPWAWLIVNGHKDIENRVWSTRYTGPLVIHASQGMTNREYDDVLDFLEERHPLIKGIELPDRKVIERGGIVGITHCNGSVDVSSSPWFFGPYGFVLSQARPLPFIPFKGMLGFFDVPNGVLP
jgi:hypothetical protein